MAGSWLAKAFTRAAARSSTRPDSPHLLEERVERRIERMSDVIVLALLMQVGRTEAQREERAAQVFGELPECVARREFAYRELKLALLRGTPFLAPRAQLADDAVDAPAAQAFVGGAAGGDAFDGHRCA
jgi:hypothetical protein